VATGAPAIVLADVAGIGTDVGAAATELADGGVAAAVSDCGVACVDGSAGAAARATSELSSGGASFFHHAQRGPDWHPTIAATVSTVHTAWIDRDFMALTLVGDQSP
jgi:hypothetical protein